MKMKSLDDMSFAIKKASFIMAIEAGESIEDTIDFFFEPNKDLSDKDKNSFVYDMFNWVTVIFVNDRNERSYNLLEFLNKKESTENNFKHILNKCNEFMDLDLDVDLHCKVWINYIQSLLNEDLQEDIRLLKEIITDDFHSKVDRRIKLQVLSSYLECLIQMPNDLMEIKKIKDLLIDLMNEN